MYTSTFVFAAKAFDTAARAIPGYLGETSWETPQTGQVANVYYWDSLAALQALVDHPLHREAKARQANWLDGYHVTISQVLRTYGDGKLGAPTGSAPQAARP